MEREALKLALEALKIWEQMYPKSSASPYRTPAITAIKEALAQPAHEQWNAALDHAAARIGEIKGFGQATQDSFATYIKGLKR